MDLKENYSGAATIHTGYECCSGKVPSPMSFHYHTYGLRLSSQVEFPELTEMSHYSISDVQILIHPLPKGLDKSAAYGKWLQYTEDCCQILIKGVASFRIGQGRYIQIDRQTSMEPHECVAESDVRPYLLGTAFGALLHQRHWLPLHVSALSTPSGVWAFTGASGAGKSTLAAWLHYHYRWPLISDDVAVIKPKDTRPYLYPGPPRLKLWKDALSALEIDYHGLARDLTRAEKYHLVQYRGFMEKPKSLQALVVLERTEEGEKASVTQITGVEAFRAIMGTIYRPELGNIFNGPQRLLIQCADLAKQIRVYRFRRPWSLRDMEASIKPLLNWINSDVSGKL
ncbi:phosphoenolpyruvate carboxykinase (ATP) [Aidingimonas lacisalsi]|uniref:hypothetical protein n=1 Tax=Aidingimonas lacisalsi TaxID=2604086 RepID=UPI0011D2A2CB|nr:hypothetical protein [Aidingimonas lacisalsi]